MAIIVDKVEKRRNIALACKDILYEHGIKNITISQISQTAGVGKGTIYEYFDNKEDIVFEIITIHISEHLKDLESIMNDSLTIKEKLFYFFYSIYKDEIGQQQLKVYREFLAIAMTNGTKDMIDFNLKCRNKFLYILGEIIQKGVDDNLIHEEMHKMKSSMLTFGAGLVVNSHVLGLDPKEEIENFLNNIFNFMKKEEEL
ncbi:transcriptional regulator, TetR family [hydrothermal vent metagenome]|uniref:Transcriptional regulator, TetR family n=1 Tax=hydrothermal vent metagenome TaxID=652676 RepID=A0A1W1EFK6_9ZZZZ